MEDWEEEEEGSIEVVRAWIGMGVIQWQDLRGQDVWKEKLLEASGK